MSGYLSTVILLFIMGSTPLSGQWVFQGRVDPWPRSDTGAVTLRILSPGGAILAAVLPDGTGAFRLAVPVDTREAVRLEVAAGTELRTFRLIAVPGAVTSMNVEIRDRVVLVAPVFAHTTRSELSERMTGFHERARLGFGYFLTRGEIADRLGATQLSDLVRTVPGIVLKRPAGSGMGYVAWTLANVQGVSRRSGCPMYMFVDGMPVHGEQGWSIDMIPSAQLEGVEVYRGASEVPGLYAGPHSGCGVIAVWTRRS